MTLKDGKATIIVMRLAEGVLFMQPSGGSSLSVDQALFEELESEVSKAGRLEFFCDAREQTRMPRETRDLAGEWAKAHREQFTSHILVTSKFLEMALSVISMVSGSKMTVYSSEARFLAAIQNQVPTFKKLPARRSVA